MEIVLGVIEASAVASAAIHPLYRSLRSLHTLYISMLREYMFTHATFIFCPWLPVVQEDRMMFWEMNGSRHWHHTLQRLYTKNILT